MIVDITATAVTLTDPDDCGRFHVRTPSDLSPAQLDAVLAGTGAGRRSGPDQVAVNVDWVRSAADGVTPDWDARFQQMLTFAATKGWLTDDGAAVLGHLTHD